jgi:hypothetical protein
VKERGILFSAPMVRALLDGSKTQTRRIAKDIPYGPDADHYGTPIMDWGLSGVYQDETNSSPDRWWLDIQTEVDDNSHREIRCPYGKPGDRLWVRETFCQSSFFVPCPIIFKADGVGPYPHPDGGMKRWTPSIHMPRWASRITLEITNIRVERLQDISEADAIAEGISIWSETERHGIKWECPQHIQRFGDDDNIEDVCFDGGPVKDPREAYRGVWSSINGPGSWEVNPWVWCVSFKRILDMEQKS